MGKFLQFVEFFEDLPLIYAVGCYLNSFFQVSCDTCYIERSGSFLPGYVPKTQFLGTQTYNGELAPGFPFLAGWQDEYFAADAFNKIKSK